MRYDALQEFKKYNNGKSVLLICSEFAKPFVDNDSFFTEIKCFNIKKVSRSLSYYYVFSRFLKKCYADKIYFQAWERYIEGDMIISCLKGKDIIGMRGITNRDFLQRYYDNKYTKLLEYPKNQHELLQIESYVRFTINPSYHYGKNPMRLVKSDFEGITSPYVVVSISSSRNEKKWPIERFAKIVDSLTKKILVVIAGSGKDDLSGVESLLQMVSNRDNLVSLVNKTSILEFASLISQSLFVIGNDSAAVHIAAATRVPSICIHHGAHFGRFLPYPTSVFEEKYRPRVVCYKMDCYNCDYNCIYKETFPFRCLSNVSVEMVQSEVDKLLLELGVV